MGRFSEVTKEQAEKFLSDVEFGKHFVGTKINPMSGGLPFIITNLQEAEEFLYVSDFQGLKIMGNGSSVSYVDFEKLKNWVAEAVGDEELANAIGEEIAKGTCFADRIGQIKELMAERLEQLKAI